MVLRSNIIRISHFVFQFLIVCLSVTDVKAQWQHGQKFNIEEERYTAKILWETGNTIISARIPWISPYCCFIEQLFVHSLHI